MSTNTSPRLSVIIPIYNGAAYLENTVRSILASSYPNLELLLIDDGSTDVSLTICEALASSDARIKVYHKANSGIADTRNYGLGHATGDYISFCDQDDEVSREMYQIMLDRIVADGSQAAICGCYRQKKDGSRIIFERYTDNVFDKPSIREKLLLPMLFQGFTMYANKEISIYPTIWNCIISRQLIHEKKMTFRSFIHYEDDLIMLLQLLLRADRISTLSDILYCWNTNTQSELHRSSERYLDDLESRQQTFMDYVINLLAKNDIASEIIKQYTYVQQCRNALLQLDNLAALDGRKTVRSIKELRTCYSISYICSAHNTVPSARGFIRNTFIIPLIRKKHVITAYCMNQLINDVRFFVEKYQITERLERKLKRTS